MNRFHEVLEAGRQRGPMERLAESIEVALGVHVYHGGPTPVRHADAPTVAVGGTVIDRYADPETGEFVLKVVQKWRGQIKYHTIPEADAEIGASGNLMRHDLVRNLLLALSEDETKRGDPMRHMHAKTVLTGLLYRAGHR